MAAAYFSIVARRLANAEDLHIGLWRANALKIFDEPVDEPVNFFGSHAVISSCRLARRLSCGYVKVAALSEIADEIWWPERG